MSHVPRRGCLQQVPVLRPVDGAVLPPLHKRSHLMFALLELAWKSLVSFAGELFALSCFDGTAEEVGGNRNTRITRCHLKSQHDATWTANTQMKKLVAVQHCEEHCEKTPGGSLQVLLKKHMKDRGGCNQRAQRLGFTRADKFHFDEACWYKNRYRREKETAVQIARVRRARGTTARDG